MKVELLGCPNLPDGYTLVLRIRQEGSQYGYMIDVIAPGSYRTVLSLELHPTRLGAIATAASAAREHLERFTTLYPAGVRSRITTWLNTLTVPAENEQPLF